MTSSEYYIYFSGTFAILEFHANVGVAVLGDSFSFTFHFHPFSFILSSYDFQYSITVAEEY